MKTFFATAALAACAMAASSDHWAVIMAGSNTYSNYRHQADSHHAVKIMLENGIPRENIIHLAYDDIAENYRNPFQGQLFNKPTAAGTPGVNVYDKSEIDYSGRDVNKQNFFNVLLGDDSNGPALKSDSNSKVFVYFVDHGGAGLICTPQGSSDWIYADELDSVLQQMSDNGMFSELTFYLEACESGSMFPNLTDKENIYAMTASNATLSSWGAYCGSEATIDGTSIGSCLGDLFSINWMEDTEANDVSVETLEQQYETVVTKTTKSSVQKFGDFTFMSEPIGDFEGTCDNDATLTETLLAKATHYYKQAINQQPRSGEMVDSRDHDLHVAYQRVLSEGSTEAYEELQAELEHRQFIDRLFSQHVEDFANAPEIPQDFDCLRVMVGGVEDLCGPFSAYSLKYVRKLANLCDTKPEEVTNTLVRIGEYCNAF